jgi:UDP-N-acetylglucosamine 2-epimerase
MIRIATIVGARPQFVKAAAVSRSIRAKGGSGSGISEVMIHTGQHYDREMSSLFFEELAIPPPDYNLGIGSGRHGQMTGAMLGALEEVLLKEKPEWVMVYGDTNSTLAGALAAAKLQIPVAHVEAGLRSFNRRMPEEINRVVTDRLSRLLFAPTPAAARNLASEGILDGVVVTGDVMRDAFLHFGSSLAPEPAILKRLGVGAREYCLATVHRQENTDDRLRLESIMAAFERIGRRLKVVLPLHPRTRAALGAHGLRIPSEFVKVTDPVGYLDMLQLEANAAVILTDSGGVQKEACFAGVPCVTLREETEWTETVAAGVNALAGASTEAIVAAFNNARGADMGTAPGLYGNGQAAEIIVRHLMREAAGAGVAPVPVTGREGTGCAAPIAPSDMNGGEAACSS